MKILIFSTHNQACGIADYSDRFAAAMAAQGHELTFFESPTNLLSLSKDRYADSMKSLKELASKHDVLHVQHEFGFFKPWQAGLLGDALRSEGKGSCKTVVTFHTTPPPSDIKPGKPSIWGRLFPKVWKPSPPAVAGDEAYRIHFESFAGFDWVLVHSTFGRSRLKNHRVFKPDRIRVIPHPIQAPRGEPVETERWKAAATRLALDPNDVLLLAPGFIGKSKGQKTTVKALSLLPPHFKLIIAGGIHPAGKNHQDLDAVYDEVVSRELQSRVLYTGYLSEADLECFAFKSDIVVLPYELQYPSSSGIIGVALQAGKPVVATRTRGFVELAQVMSGIKLCDSPAYADVARSILEVAESPFCDAKTIREEARTLSYDVVARNVVEQYYA